MDKRILLALNRLRFLRIREKLFLSDCITDEQQFLSLTKSRVIQLLGRNLRTSAWDSAAILRQGERDLRYVERNGITLAPHWSPKYPPQLWEIYDPPLLLFLRGTVPNYHLPMLAAVGTRKPTGRALKAAYQCGLELGLQGVESVSGLARGIDKAVHRGSIDGGGATVAVLGSGIDAVYPKEHRKLGEEIIETGGVIISEYGPGVPPLRYNFPERNRIISGLARAVIVVQSPGRSGALITADYALEQGRELVVHGKGLEGNSGKGGRELSEDGARIIFSVNDLLSDWGYNAIEKIKTQEKVTESLGTGALLAYQLEKEIAGKAVSRLGAYWEL